MDSIENDLINSIEDAGFSISNEAPAELQEEQQALGGIPEGVEADFDFSGTQQTEEPATEPQATEQVSETAQPQVEESSLNTETNVEQQEDVDVDGLVLGYLSETLGMDLNTIDD